MSDLNTYYERYKQTYGAEGYRMERAKDTSRVQLLVEFVTKHVPKGGKVLDVGCGDMYLSRLLPEYDWTGIDIAPDMSNGKAVKHDLMQAPYPFEARSFDGVVCSEVLEHLWDLRVVNKEVKRLLKTTGVYIMSTPNFDHLDYMLTHYRGLLFNPEESHLFEHIRQYNYDVHKRHLTEAGFNILDYTGADAHFTVMFQEARQELSKLLGITVFEADKILGRCFKKFSHTIMFVSR